MEFDLFQSALFTAVIILGFIFWGSWAWCKIGDLDKENGNLKLSEKGMAVQLKVWEREKAAWDCGKAAMEAERSAWGEEKKKLEAAASEGAVVKADYEGRLRGFTRIMSRKAEKGVGKVEKSVWKYAHLFEEGLGDMCSSGSLAKAQAEGSVMSEGLFDAERGVNGSVTSQGSSYARGVDCVSREVVKAAELAKDAAENREKAALAAKDAAEVRAEKAEARVKELCEELKAAEGVEAAKKKAEGRVKELSEELKAALAAKLAAENRERATLAAKNIAEGKAERASVAHQKAEKQAEKNLEIAIVWERKNQHRGKKDEEAAGAKE
eukprot:413257-Rhodomonas_salina.2